MVERCFEIEVQCRRKKCNGMANDGWREVNAKRKMKGRVTGGVSKQRYKNMDKKKGKRQSE